MTTKETQTDIWDAISAYGTAEHQAGVYPGSDHCERETRKTYDEVVRCVNAKDDEIERLKTENATLKEALRVKNTGYAYETSEMKTLRQKYIEESERFLSAELQHNQQYERSTKARHRAFREEYTRLEHEALSRLSEPEAPKAVDCTWCNGKGMRYNVDAGFQCRECKGTGKKDA
jgi:hypothetical protein